jgi:hypothetical protein
MLWEDFDVAEVLVSLVSVWGGSRAQTAESVEEVESGKIGESSMFMRVFCKLLKTC